MMHLMRRLTRVLLIVAAICALPLSAEVLRVTAPQAGATLHGGSFATLEWTAGALPPHAEEWEAFLSIDGGKYYAFRITPHLDIDRRHFDFIVPNVDTSNARILIRTGDEKRESLFELAERFSIVRDARASTLPHVLTSARGPEAAREGDPAVIAWADGDRAGSRATQQAAATTSTRIAAVASERRSWSPVVAPKTLRASSAVRLTVARAPASQPFANIVDHDVPPADLLLVCRRRNI